VRQRPVVVLDRPYPGGDLRLHHHQRGVEQFVYIDDLVRGPVDLGILLGGPDQRGDTGDRVVDLPHEQFGFDRVREPSDGRLEVRLAERAGDLVQPRRVDAPGDEGRGEVPAAHDVVVVQPVAERVLGVGGRHR
jgi:hypothetical protein